MSETSSSFSLPVRLGRYEIQTLIGKGGGGRVYRALDTDLKRAVALKVLDGDANAPGSRRRLLREAELASSLNHPNIVTVYEVGVDGPAAFIAMEYIEGGTLRQSLQPGGLPLERLLPWAMQIADALAAAHEAGIVHRDLKPGNVMITSRGSAKVVDFGLAKGEAHGDGSEETSEETMTLEGYVSGTSGYMAPEQAEGKPIDARADIFAFGCVLYEMSTGVSAFGAPSPAAAMANVLRSEPAPVRSLAPHQPASLERLIGLCLRKNPAARWRSAADLLLLLGTIEKEGPAPGPTAPGKSKSAWPAVALLLAILSVALGAAYWKSRSADSAPRFRTIAVTSDAGLTTAPSLSGDGRLLAYASDRASGNLDIWVQQIGGQAPIRVTADPADEMDPDLSPDGTRIVYRSEKDGGAIWVAPALGGEPMLLVQGGRNPRFSPDGQSIAYWTGREGGRLAAGTAKAWVIPAGGGQPKALGADLAAACYPVWSPAGDVVVLLGRKSADVAVEPMPEWYAATSEGASVPLKTGESIFRTLPERLNVPLTQYHIVPLEWTAEDGGTLLFSASTGDAVNLWALPVDPASKRVKGPPRRITNGAGAETRATAAGTRLAFADTSLQFDLWAIATDQAEDALRRLTDDLSWELFPTLAWDGGKVAYVATRGGADALCVRELATGRETTLLSAPRLLSPILSGDGTSIAFLDARNQITRIAARGGASATVCANCGSPVDANFDGGRVVVEPFDSPEDVRAIDVATGKAESLVPARKPLYSGHVSRDGAWIVFNEVISAEATQISVAPLEGGKAAPPERWIAVTDGTGVHQGPQWSPDGASIYYLSERDGFRCVWMQKLNPRTKAPNGPPRALRHFHEVRRSLRHLRSFDDRTRLAVGKGVVVVSLGELRGNIWLRESVR
ncbi:MAG TPA: hypothetical protein DEH78_19695 [Solibacterales bacterium]|nr:hypothetical protein [Bryobacterales bacterium]